MVHGGFVVVCGGSVVVVCGGPWWFVVVQLWWFHGGLWWFSCGGLWWFFLQKSLEKGHVTLYLTNHRSKFTMKSHF